MGKKSKRQSGNNQPATKRSTPATSAEVAVEEETKAEEGEEKKTNANEEEEEKKAEGVEIDKSPADSIADKMAA